MRTEFIPVDIDYIDVNDKNVIRMFGRTKEGKRCCVIDKCDDYFWVFPRKNTNFEDFAEKIKAVELSHAGRFAKVVDVKIKDKNYMGKNVRALQVFVSNHKDISAVVEVVKRMPETSEKKEIDFNFITRYLIDKGIVPLALHSVEGREIEKQELEAMKMNLDVDFAIEASSVKTIDKNRVFKPKILSFDIEASEPEIGKGNVLMVSLFGENLEKTITLKKFEGASKNVVFAKNEKELLKEFVKTVKDYKPDCLAGYFSDGFDLPYLRERADKNDLRINIGIDNSNVSFIRGIIQSAKIAGIVHIDLYKFVNNTIAYILQSETISLNNVAKELIGEEKLDMDVLEITKQFKKGVSVDWKRYYLYNLQDAMLTYKLALKLWPNISELAKFIGEPLFSVSRSSYSQLVENYIIHNLKEFNEICPNRPTHEKIAERRERPRYTGAFVFQPEPGLYENIAVFDFRSFWPSIIVSFNLSPASIQESSKDSYETPEVDMGGEKKKFYFSKKRSFIPELLNKLLEERKKIKAEKKKNPSPILEARDYNLKTLSNATYGYLGFFGARYYSPESSASAVAISRVYIHKMIDELKSNDYKVIYSDTDSIHVLLGNKTEKEVLSFLKKLNEDLPGTMELELEDFYKSGIFVLKRTGELGAKKKYALLSKSNKIKIRGFETVRRDWCDLAKETQDEILRMILKEGNAENALVYAKKVIKELKDKKVAVEKLIIRTQLKKGIDDYEAIGPHVVIAKRMIEKGIPINEGSLIEYVIAKAKSAGNGMGKSKAKGLIRDKAKLPDEVKEGDYDVDYYIHNQIMHAIGNIFEVFNINIEELADGKKQKKLGDF